MASPNIKRKVAVEYEKMNDEIAEKYLNKDKLFLKPIPDGDNSWKPYEMDVEDAVKVSALVFISLTQKVHALQDQVNILRQVFKK